MFEDSYAFVFKEEGGYVNDPQDSGGATSSGVTQLTYDLYRSTKKLPSRHVRFLTRLERIEIFQLIWEDCKASVLPAGLDTMHFDSAVNVGNRQAAKFLQRTVGTTDDGVIGSKTLTAVAGCNVTDSIRNYAEQRRAFYRNLAETRPKDLKFLRGWINRTNRCEKLALSQVK